VKVLVLEKNLLWSSRVRRTLEALGHAVTVTAVAPLHFDFDIALVGLADDSLGEIGRLREAGIFVIGHAGHKEKELIARGLAAGCSRVLSNSELTFKLPQALEALAHAG
jgi:hypothetical protein